MPRPRPALPGVTPADRVRGLLSHAAAGWVPPARPDDGLGTGAAGPQAAAAVRPEAGAEVGPERGVPEPGVPEPGVPGGVPVGPDAGAEGRWRLPPALRNGRFDPGRRGAVALVLVALLAALATGGVVLRGRPQEVAVPEVLRAGVPVPGSSAEAGPPADPPAEVVVAVSGKVHRPGLVRLPAGSRVDDALRAAGGPLDPAALGLLNLARLLVDGEQVLVGVEPLPVPGGGPVGAPGSAGGTAATGGPVDLNSASVSDFDGLPGIGPVLAQRIVDWRTENGRFASVDQLREVTGIGEAKFADLRAKVAVR